MFYINLQLHPYFCIPLPKHSSPPLNSYISPLSHGFPSAVPTMHPTVHTSTLPFCTPPSNPLYSSPRYTLAFPFQHFISCHFPSAGPTTTTFIHKDFLLFLPSSLLSKNCFSSIVVEKMQHCGGEKGEAQHACTFNGRW